MPTMMSAVLLGYLHAGFGLGAGVGPGIRNARGAQMVTMHAGKQNHVDLAELRILGPGHGKAGVEQETRAIRIFEQHGAARRQNSPS